MSITINMDVVSDFACPWCLVGKRRLEQAIGQRPELDIRLNWLPFQLNPEMPREGRNRRDYYRNKFGAERLKNLRLNLNDAGAGEGIVFCDEPEAVAPNTLSAHVLMFWASNDESIDHNTLAERLFLAHHVACENIGDHTVLARIAEEVGMDGAGVMSKLTAGDNENDVQEQIHRSAARGISGVPFFIINGQYGISGAQPVEILVSALDHVVKG